MSLSFNKQLKEICNKINNRLCIGLDLDSEKINNSNIKDLNDIKFFTKDII